MVQQDLLNDTLQKINASLNKRFEKDADLYISKQDEYEIKKHLCNKAYGAVIDMAKAKGISHDIIVKVIMRNAGVLDIKDIKDLKKFKKELKPILENADYNVLQYMMEDVLRNNVYMQKKIRYVLFHYYMNGITSAIRINYWKCGDFDFDKTEREDLFNIILQKTTLNDVPDELKFKLDFVQDAFKKYPSIMNDNKRILIKLKNTLSEADQGKFFKHLCKEMKNPSIKDDTYNIMLIDPYASYNKQAFDDAVSNIKSSAPNFKQYVKAVCTLLQDKHQTEELLFEMFDTMVKLYKSPYLKSYISHEINKKVWKAASNNKILYQGRKAQIDGLLENVEQTDSKKYQSFEDILVDLKNGTPSKSIAYCWVNLKSPAFEQSIMDSFTKLDDEYLFLMRGTYTSLFEHSQRKNEKELKKMCERLAQPLHEFAESGESSPYFDILDELWVKNVVKYKLEGHKISEYMFDKHFDKTKEWK